MPFKSVADMARLLHRTSGCQSPVNQICTDSRLLKSGDVFFALPGARVDGHNYLQEIAEKGASAAVVHSSYVGSEYGLCLIKVEDTLAALQQLARGVMATRKARVVGVTGSVGKTTTKEFITTLLRQKYRVACSPGNSNSQVGLPLTILNHTSPNDEILVLEMGMTHPGDITRLLKIASPEVALITTVQLVHAVNFDSLNDIANAKAEIFNHPKTRIGILSHDISNYEEICCTGTCTKFSFSLTNQNADYFLQVNGDEITIEFHGERISLGILPVPGDHFRLNFLAAVAVARCFNVNWEEIAQGMKLLALPALRMQFVEKNGVLFVNDSYNAAEISLKAALKSLPEPKAGGKKIGVIGEMFELGKFSEACHQAVGEFALHHVENMFCFGPGCQPIVDIWKKNKRPVDLFLKRTELVEALRKAVQPGDVVLLKGSRGNTLWKVLEEF